MHEMPVGPAPIWTASNGYWGRLIRSRPLLPIEDLPSESRPMARCRSQMPVMPIGIRSRQVNIHVGQPFRRLCHCSPSSRRGRIDRPFPRCLPQFLLRKNTAHMLDPRESLVSARAVRWKHDCRLLHLGPRFRISSTTIASHLPSIQWGTQNEIPSLPPDVNGLRSSH